VAVEPAAATTSSSRSERQFSRDEALRTPAFWLLALYTALIFPCQAGVSLYQASHLVSRGIEPAGAALIVSSFSFMSMLASLGVGWLPSRWPVRHALAACAMLMSCGAALLLFAGTFAQGWSGSALFGMGVGAILALLPVVWADYFGRTSYGAIRGVALSIQVLAQACGPLAAGALRDTTGSHAASLGVFSLLAALAVGAVLLARRPQ
jgi:cyanate permease